MRVMAGQCVGRVAALALGRNQCVGATDHQMVMQSAGVIAAIGDKSSGAQVGQQLLDRGSNRHGTGREQGAYGSAPAGGEQAHLCVQPAVGLSEGWVRPFFNTLALVCCYVWTVVESSSVFRPAAKPANGTRCALATARFRQNVNRSFPARPIPSNSGASTDHCDSINW